MQFDHFEMDDVAEILPGLTEPQQRVLDVALRYWRTADKTEPRDINRLRHLLGDGIEELREWDDLSEAEGKALNGRSAAVTSMKLSRVLNEAQSFYSAAMSAPTDIYKMIGRPSNKQGRLVVIDLQGLSDTAKQVICALLSSEILRAASSKTDPLRPCFLVYEEGHNFAPAGGSAVSHRIIKKIAGEGRKFGVGFAIVSQRPSKLDADVTSQCNTLITMRLKNPDDQRFIAKASDMVSKADLDELPNLSTGEALVCGRSIPASLLVKVGGKALIHGGESPEVLRVWGVLVTDLPARICSAMSTLEFVDRSYPMLSSWGVRDEDVLVHSLGCSAWNELGSELGFMAVAECPVPMTHGADIRADSTWFSRTQRTPDVLIEFERFDGTDRGQKKLDEKLCNLLEASMRWGDAPLC
ncbi:ATP-binding protein [Pseudomonas aeruginosa]|uniref:ATP-binding protein n=2 Tax=Pseudomonas aeruginosa TaxID=287 RepID=UPI0039082AD8